MSSLPATPLISLKSVQDWLASDGKPFPSTSNELLERMIAAVSQFAVTYVNRPIVPSAFTEVYNGTGGRALPLRQTPVIAVQALTVGTTVIPARGVPGSYGFTNDQRSVYIDGFGCGWNTWGGGWGGNGWNGAGVFWQGIQNVSVTYTAGFQVAEAWTVPAVAVGSTNPVIDAGDLQQVWNSSVSVTYATGTALTKVATTPSVVGTYQVTNDPPYTNSTYVFAVADVGASIVVTYGFTPGDMAQALIELLAERYRSRGRIGETTQMVGPSRTAAFSQKDMNASAKAMLQQYRRMSPI